MHRAGLQRASRPDRHEIFRIVKVNFGEFLFHVVRE
jgi:hypothetical protein